MTGEQFTDYLKWIATSVAVVSTVVSFLVSALTRPRRLIALANAREEKRDLAAEVRLPEIKRLIEEESSRKIKYGIAAGSLAFGQFIIGGLLASSFIAENLSKGLIGLLGLLVLAASLIQQHFRPDVLQKAAAHRLYRLKTIQRWAEDEVYDILRLPMDDDRVASVRRKVSDTLGEIDHDGLITQKDEKA